MDYNFIAVEGNIGAGKTTLAKMLADHYRAELLLEGFEDNAFLPKFYREPERYAFPLELSFLADRFQQLKAQALGPNLFSSVTVSDYFIGKSLIFARTNLGPDEYKLFWQLFEIMFQNLTKPDLLVYLYSPVDKLLSNIRKRGRRYEQNIQREYLESIQQQYLEYLRKHASHMRVVLLDTSNLDFVKNKSDFENILNIIETPVEKGVFKYEL
jgi:deoxyadenosine/deoxycytidine kinase